jgi:hypothetical protein
MNTETLTRDEQLGYVLSLAAQLEAEKARALAAETTIANALKHWKLICNNTFVSPMEVILQTVDLTHARDTLRRAARADELEQRDGRWLDTFRAIAVDGAGLTDPYAPHDDEYPKDWAENEFLSQTVRKIREERDALRTEKQGLLAMVERLKGSLNELLDYRDGAENPLDDQYVLDRMDTALALIPADALADLREGIRREVLTSNWQPWPPNDNDTNECLAFRDDAGIFPAQCVYAEDTGEPTWFAWGGIDDLTGDPPKLWHPMPLAPVMAEPGEGK